MGQRLELYKLKHAGEHVSMSAPMSPTKVAISSAIAILLLYAAIFIFDRWQNFKDPQGEANDNCIKEDLPSVSNHSGLVVTAHNTVCDGFGGSSTIYVYVHKSGASDDRGTLVFRYGDAGYYERPKIAWTSESSVLISVGHVSEVSKKLSTMQGVDISYVIGKEDHPRKN